MTKDFKKKAEEMKAAEEAERKRYIGFITKNFGIDNRKRDWQKWYHAIFLFILKANKNIICLRGYVYLNLFC